MNKMEEVTIKIMSHGTFAAENISLKKSRFEINIYDINTKRNYGY